MLNYNNKIQSNKPNTKQLNKVGQTKEYEPAEVVDVIYDENHSKYTSDIDIGAIVFRRLYTDYNQKYDSLSIARPANNNQRLYPLRYEIVMIYKSISPHTGTNNQSTTFYYDNPISVWNLQNHNALPFSTISTNREKQNDYTKFTGVNSTRTQNIVLGSYFSEQPIVNKLKPFEGDYIIQGRYGHSIRFANTTIPNTDNQWSKQGKAGDPLIILNANRNTANSFNYRLENINTDDVNIWMTTSQTIPFKLTAKEQEGFVKSYKPDLINKYKQPQIIINGERIILNAKKDSVMLSADKSIYISSNDNVILNSNKYVGINSSKIYLGNKLASNETEPFVLGNQLLNTLITIIDNMTTAIYGTAVGPTTPMLPPQIITLQTLKTNLQTTKYILSKKTFGE